jgi:hypothetical protein
VHFTARILFIGKLARRSDSRKLIFISTISISIIVSINININIIIIIITIIRYLIAGVPAVLLTSLILVLIGMKQSKVPLASSFQRLVP